MPDPGRPITITLEAGKLFGQSNGADKRELKAEADGLFGTEGTLYKVRFGRDPNGNVTHLQVLVNGQEIARAEKMK